MHGSYSCFTSSVTKAKPWWCCDFSQFGTFGIGKHCCCGSQCSRKVRKSKACLMKSMQNGTSLLKWDLQEAKQFKPLSYLYKWCFQNYKILERYLNILLGSENSFLITRKSSVHLTLWTSSNGHKWSGVRKDFGQNGIKSSCFQVQPATCYDLPIFFSYLRYTP